MPPALGQPEPATLTLLFRSQAVVREDGRTVWPGNFSRAPVLTG